MQNFEKENDGNEQNHNQDIVKDKIPEFTRKQKIVFYGGVLMIYLIFFLIYYFYLRDIFPKPYFPPTDDF